MINKTQLFSTLQISPKIFPPKKITKTQNPPVDSSSVDSRWGKLAAFALGVAARFPGDTLEPVLISGAQGPTGSRAITCFPPKGRWKVGEKYWKIQGEHKNRNCW